jgi:BirA family biotin operon repressor/biotin-[acetyl-CoA-carboxylase] ligase
MAPPALAALSHLTILDRTDSTNSALMRLEPRLRHAHALLADSQTAGRGRRKRGWHSPPGGNLYFSLGWRLDHARISLSALPLVVAVCLSEALADAGLREHGIKWPNDILVGPGKLAGILVESQSAGSAMVLAVIGIGLNVRMPPLDSADSRTAIDQPWTDLASELSPGTGKTPGRNRLAALLLNRLLPGLQRFEQLGFDAFRAAWAEFDLLHGQSVSVNEDGRVRTGVARGVDGDGALLLESPGRGIEAVRAADVSVRRA